MRILPLLAGCLLLAILVACEEDRRIDTSKLQSSFSASTPAMKAEMNKIVDDVKAGRYSDALTGLKNLASQAKLTPEQRDAVRDVMSQVQARVSEGVQKTGEEAKKAAEDLKKSVGR